MNSGARLIKYSSDSRRACPFSSVIIITKTGKPSAGAPISLSYKSCQGRRKVKAGSQKFSTLIVARSGVSCLVSSRMLVQFIIGPSSKHLCMPVMEGARSRLGNIRKRARICIVLFCYLHFSGCCTWRVD